MRESIDSLKTEGYHFDHKAEMDIITLAHKRDMTYDCYLKQNMPAFEWKLNAIINKDKILINKFPQTWGHPINMKFKGYRNNVIYMEIVKEYVFHSINIEDVDEIIVKASS